MKDIRDLEDQVAKLLDDKKRLEDFIKAELGLNPKVEASNCAVPTNYCAGCSCGKKERIEGKKK